MIPKELYYFMAKANLNPLITEFKGHIENVTFSKTIGGISAKQKSFQGSRNSYTASKTQLYLRDQFALLPVLWCNISESNRQSWIKLAKKTKVKNAFGNSYNPSGYILFISNNSNLQMVGQPPINSAPEKLAIPSITNYSILISNSPTQQISILFPSVTTGANISHLVYSSPGLSAGRNYVLSEYRMVSIIPPGTSNTFDITKDYTNIFSFPDIGKKLFFKLVPIHNLTGFQGSITKNSHIFTQPVPSVYWTLNQSELDINTTLK